MTIRSALVVAASFLTLAVAVAFAEKAGRVSGETGDRIVQIVAGLVVVYYANLVPKTLERSCARCSPSRVQALQRFSGRMLVLGGLGYALAWALLPYDRASLPAQVILGGSVVAVIVRWSWTVRTGGGGSGSPTGRRSVATD